MSHALIERYFSALNARDIGGVIDLLDDDIVHDPRDDERQIGREAFERYLIRHFQAYRERVDAITIFTADSETRFAAEYVLAGDYVEPGANRAAGSALRYSVPGASFFEIDDGRISRITTYAHMTAG